MMESKWDSLTRSKQDDRFRQQIVSEEEMLLVSRNRYWKEYYRAPDESIPEQKVLDSAIVHLEPRYQEWIDLVCKNTKTPEWVHPLLVLGARKMADLTIRSLMRAWLTPSVFGYRFAESNKPPTAQVLSNLIAQEALNIINFMEAKDSFKEDWRKQSKFIKNWTPKRCAAFAKKVSNIRKMTLKQRQDFGHHMIRIAEQSSIVTTNLKREKTRAGWRNYLFVELSEEILKDLHEQHYLLELSSLLYRPMLVPPIDHTMSISGGLLTPNVRKPVVQKYRSNLVEDKKEEQCHSEPSQKVLDGLNTLQRTEWAINVEVYEVMQNLFTNNTMLCNLPSYNFEEFVCSGGEYPIDGTKTEQAIWCQNREEAWGSWYKQEQSRGRMLVRLNLASKLIKHGFFYMPYTLDFRGRAYSICELLSSQSSDFDRGLIMFSTPMEQTIEGLKWQKIYLANLFGIDKSTFDDRIAWVDKHWDRFKSIAEDPYSDYFWVDNSKKKNKSFQRLSTIKDLMRTDGLTQVPVHIDGKCNGSQHWSAIMRDKQLADLTNVTSSIIPQDLYQHVADRATEYIKFHKDENPILQMFIDHWSTLDRAVTKRSTMCDSYGLTFYGIQKYTRSEGHVDWIPKDKRGAAVVELAKAIQAGLTTTLESSNRGKDYLKSVANIYSENNKQLSWTTPSGFRVVHIYNTSGSRRSLAKLFNSKELQFFYRTNDVDPRAVRQAISPNYIHSLDAAHMFLTIYQLIDMGFQFLSMIHDSYGCHAPLIGTLRDVIRKEFLIMHSENLLEKFREEVQSNLGKMLPEPPQIGGLSLNEVLDSDYFFS